MNFIAKVIGYLFISFLILLSLSKADSFAEIYTDCWQTSCGPIDMSAGTNNLSHFCKAFGIKGLTARLFTVYGPGEHAGRLLPSLWETAKTGKPISLTTWEQKRGFP